MQSQILFPSHDRRTENAYYDFDSVWSTEAGATDYCESKFETAWDYYVTRVNLDEAEYE